MEPMISVCELKTKTTKDGEKTSVMVVMNDLFYFKGDIKKNKEGKEYIVFSNSPWKNNEGKWMNNYLAGFVSDDLKVKVERWILGFKATGKTTYKDANPVNTKNYDAWQLKLNNYKTGNTQSAGAL